MKRLGLYVFYEKNGEVRNFHKYYLLCLKNCIDDIVVIVNGKLSAKGREDLENIGLEIVVRDNVGYDFSAWRDVILEKGLDCISNYDELVLCNCSCYGPVYPFTSVFSRMETESCDFWGLYDHPELKGYFPHHLQSYFLVLRKRLLQSRDFKVFWKNLNTAASWQDAVNQETSFTKYFEDRGFLSKSFCDQKLSDFTPNPTVQFASQLLNIGFPLIKRKCFTEGYWYHLQDTDGSQAVETLRYLQEKTEYPVDYIYEDLIATMPASDLRETLHLTYVIPDDGELSQTQQIGRKLALILFSYYSDLIDFNLAYINSMPEYSTIYVVVVSEEIKALWESKRRLFLNKKLVIRKQENRGRNECAYWLTCRDVVSEYDYICLVHDKKTPSARPKIRGYYFAKHCMNGVMKSLKYVQGIIDLFENNPKIGILMPPAPLFSVLTDCILYREWAGNKEIAQDVYRKLNLAVPFDEAPYCPWGAMFWVRGGAMKAFYRYEWKISDFPEEPIKVPNGTVLHALERMYPMIAQESGYLTAVVMPASEASVHYDNLYHQLREEKRVLTASRGKVHFCDVKQLLKQYLKQKFKFSGL